MQRRLRIGLTGGIASGKSTVGERFIELGVPVIDADVAARAVVEPNTPGLAQVMARFGAEIITADGALNRPALRELIFGDPQAREDLEGIIHPLVRTYMDKAARLAEGPYLVLSIPLLIESGNARQRVDRILVVDVDEATQLKRLLARDGSSEEQARAIMASQATRAARLELADDLLENTGTVTKLRQSVNRLHARYLMFADARARAPHLT